jgi:hypothetical protein
MGQAILIYLLSNIFPGILNAPKNIYVALILTTSSLVYSYGWIRRRPTKRQGGFRYIYCNYGFC